VVLEDLAVLAVDPGMLEGGQVEASVILPTNSQPPTAANAAAIPAKLAQTGAHDLHDFTDSAVEVRAFVDDGGQNLGPTFVVDVDAGDGKLHLADSTLHSQTIAGLQVCQRQRVGLHFLAGTVDGQHVTSLSSSE